jgi:hypothetical protein
MPLSLRDPLYSRIVTRVIPCSAVVELLAVLALPVFDNLYLRGKWEQFKCSAVAFSKCLGNNAIFKLLGTTWNYLMGLNWSSVYAYLWAKPFLSKCVIGDIQICLVM